MLGLIPRSQFQAFREVGPLVAWNVRETPSRFWGVLIPQHLRWLNGLKMAFISKLLYTFQKLDMFLCQIFYFTTTWCSESFKFQIGSCEHESKTAQIQWRGIVGSDVFIDPLHLLAHIEYTYLLGYTWSVYVLSILEGLAIHLTDRDHNYKFGARQPKLFVINYNLGDSIHIWNFKYILLNCHVNSLNKINSAYKMWV